MEGENKTLNDWTNAGKQVFPRGSSKPDHRTPHDLFKYMDEEVGGFDLDAAASVENHLCEKYFTEEDDGLEQYWGRGKAWCNPPYSNWGKWAAKAFHEVTDGFLDEAWLLIPARTDTKAFHDYVWGRATEVRFIKGRLKFTGPHELKKNASATFPSVLVKYTRSSGYHQLVVKTCDKTGKPHEAMPGQHDTLWGDQ